MKNVDQKFKKYSRCGIGICVQVKRTANAVLVRRNDGDPTLSFGHDEWSAFVSGVNAGEFDTPS